MADATGLAVRTVLGDPRHRAAAHRVAAEIARSGGVDQLVAVIDWLRNSRSTTGERR